LELSFFLIVFESHITLLACRTFEIFDFNAPQNFQFCRLSKIFQFFHAANQSYKVAAKTMFLHAIQILRTRDSLDITEFLLIGFCKIRDLRHAQKFPQNPQTANFLNFWHTEKSVKNL
jgi:hypothetical protein